MLFWFFHRLHGFAQIDCYRNCLERGLHGFFYCCRNGFLFYYELYELYEFMLFWFFHRLHGFAQIDCYRNCLERGLHGFFYCCRNGFFTTNYTNCTNSCYSGFPQIPQIATDWLLSQLIGTRITRIFLLLSQCFFYYEIYELYEFMLFWFFHRLHGFAQIDCYRNCLERGLHGFFYCCRNGFLFHYELDELNE